MDYNQFRAPPPPAGPSVLDALPKEYVAALKRTPRGILTLHGLKKFDREKYRGTFAGVKVVTTAFPDGAHAHTQSAEGGGLETEITTFNQQAGDRMQGWSAEEILNVVGVHEFQHIVFADDGPDIDHCIGTYCPCHVPVVSQELVTRIQFSLVHPTRSTPGKGWMDRYLDYFALARHVAQDGTEKRLCKRASNAATPRRQERLANELAEHDAKVRAETTLSEAEKKLGRGMAMKAYKTAVAGLKQGASLFAKEGVFDSLDAYKAVVAKAADYENDTTFALIP